MGKTKNGSKLTKVTFYVDSEQLNDAMMNLIKDIDSPDIKIWLAKGFIKISAQALNKTYPNLVEEIYQRVDNKDGIGFIAGVLLDENMRPFMKGEELLDDLDVEDVMQYRPKEFKKLRKILGNLEGYIIPTDNTNQQ